VDGYEVQVVDALANGTVAEIEGLVAIASQERAHRALGERKALHLSEASGEDTISLLARREDDDALVGYGQLLMRQAPFGLEIVVSPEVAEHETISRLLLAKALAEVEARGGAELHYWVFKPTNREDALARSFGFTQHRDLFQFRVALPLRADISAGAGKLELRAFRVGVDEPAWLDVNNRAFAGHAEQGNMDATTLARLERAPWFNADGFLVLEQNGSFIGSCWTKLHDEPEQLGEIYVISVDPSFHGQGIGRDLTIRGLDWIAAQEIDTGMLYVDAENTVAISLYQSLGFEFNHLDRSYIIRVTPNL
jgi:mycothiol synthase